MRPPRAWMFGIARNAAVDELRRRGRIAELPPDPEDRTSPGPPEVAEAEVRLHAPVQVGEELGPRLGTQGEELGTPLAQLRHVGLDAGIVGLALTPFHRRPFAA
jgi:DNA-directed RNA polymerase specialized sigma24 family protein